MYVLRPSVATYFECGPFYLVSLDFVYLDYFSVFISQFCTIQCRFEQPGNLNTVSHRQYKRLDSQVSLCYTLHSDIDFFLVRFLHFCVLSVHLTDS